LTAANLAILDNDSGSDEDEEQSDDVEGPD
jgi:hypothetical protein